MLTWANLALALLKLLDSLAGWLRESQLIKQGQIQEQNKQLKEEAKTIEVATKARDEARVASRSVPVPASLPDDGFRRD